MRKVYSIITLGVSLLILTGCGYTSTSLLPPDLKSIHVDNFVNKINPAQEVTDKRMSYSYWPGLETQLTRGVIDGFIFDRHLDVKSAQKADLTLEGELTDFRQFPLTYDEGDNVTELRVQITVDLVLINNKTGKKMWTENSFTGWSSYDVSGDDAKTEAEGVRAAVKDISQRIVERVVEQW